MSIEDVRADRMPPERKYRKAADSIAQLLSAGRELLAERGLAPGLGRVSLNDAIERSGIPRSSAYRLYGRGHGPLESYRLALLGHVAEDFLSQAERFEEIERALADQQAAIDSPDAETLAGALREVIRVGIETNMASWAASTEWLAFCSAILAASSAAVGTDAGGDSGDQNESAALTHYETNRSTHSDSNTDAADMLHAGVLRLVRGVLPLYRDMAKLAGLQLRPGADWQEFARVTSAAIEGVAIRSIIDPGLAGIDRATGLNGSSQTWNAAAIIFESLFVSYFEADPTAPVSADLTSWYR